MAFTAILGNLPLVLLLVGTALIVAEAFAPGAHFFVVGVALFAAGLVGIPLAAVLSGPLLYVSLAVVVLVSAAVTLYGYREADILGGSGQGQTSDSSSLRGQTGRVTQRVTPTEGEVKLGDGGFNPYFKARSVDGEIPEGEEVLVIDPGGGNVLTVESFATVKDDIDRELEQDRRETTDAEASADS